MIFTNFFHHKNLSYFLSTFALVFILFSAKAHPKENNISYEVISSGLHHPWSVAWLSDTRLIITERNGNLILLENDKKIILDLPVTDIFAHGQGGLFDIVLHPNFSENGWIYLSYSAYDEEEDKGATTALARFKIKNNTLKNWQILYHANAYKHTAHHFGGRIAFDDQGYLYLSVGDRGKRHLAQNTSVDVGKILRLKDDGLVPKDNPFDNAVFSYGHRNPQGLIWINNMLIAHEHGPKGGDELNIIERGKNYGWPIITYGREYVTAFKIGEGTHKKGMIQPLHYWTPSIAPSGMAYYKGDIFKNWQGDLLIGSLKFRELVHLKIHDNALIFEKRLLTDIVGRIRDVRIYKGFVYLLTDEADGRLIKLLDY